jgi:hypothetical protein
MAGLDDTIVSQANSLPRELLEFYDELTALHACNGFVLQALAAALADGGGVDKRTATGAMFCAQWLNDRSAELERRLKKIQTHARAISGSDKNGTYLAEENAK